MDHPPFIIRFFLVHFNAIIFYVNEGGFCKHLKGKHSHVLPNLYTGTPEVIGIGKQFTFDRFQKRSNGGSQAPYFYGAFFMLKSFFYK